MVQLRSVIVEYTGPIVERHCPRRQGKCWVETDGVGDQIELRPVFTGRGWIVGLDTSSQSVSQASEGLDTA
jgi:hypothetical protein